MIPLSSWLQQKITMRGVTSALFIPQSGRRIVAYASSLSKRNYIYLVLMFRDYRCYTPSLHLTPKLLLCIYSHGLCLRF